MKTGRVASIQICTGHRKPMLSCETIEAVKETGLKGDIHAIPQSTRQILLIENETLKALKIPPGAVKENITTEGIPLMSLSPRQRLQVGEVILEISKECKPCERMEEIRKGLQSDLEGRRGMLAFVIESGKIAVGDPITVV